MDQQFYSKIIKKLAKDFFSTKRTKHIDIKFHFIRQHIEEGRVNVIYIPTKDMTADVTSVD